MLCSDIHLVALSSEPSRDEMRLHWNLKDEDRLIERRELARIWIGSTDAEAWPQPGSAGAVSTLIFRDGTLPDYNAPLLTAEMVDAVLEAFDRGMRDGEPCANREDLEQFLSRHIGTWIVTDG